MKYLLVECVERNIPTPVIFNTLREAQNAMIIRICDVFKLDYNKYKDEPDIHDACQHIEDDTELEVSFYCNSDGAWVSDYHGTNYDWIIYVITPDDECERIE